MDERDPKSMKSNTKISVWKWIALWIMITALLAAAFFAMNDFLTAIAEGEVARPPRYGSGTAPAGSLGYFIGMALLLAVVGLVAAFFWALWMIARGKRKPH